MTDPVITLGEYVLDQLRQLSEPTDYYVTHASERPDYTNIWLTPRGRHSRHHQICVGTKQGQAKLWCNDRACDCQCSRYRYGFENRLRSLRFPIELSDPGCVPRLLETVLQFLREYP